MYQLNEQEIDELYRRLHSEGIKNSRLEAELFDHFCCYIAEQLEAGITFDQSYQQALSAIAPNGLKEIEFERYFIMNFNKQHNMKKVLFLISFISAFLLSTGLMFKTMDWAASNIFVFSGCAMLLIALILLAIYTTRFLRSCSTLFLVRTFTGIASLALVALGFIFRVLHIPGSNILFGVGMVILNLVFLPLFFYQTYKSGFIKSTI